MRFKTILTEILISTLMIAIIPLLIATFLNLRSTQEITKDLIHKHQDTLIANLQETEADRVKSLAIEINILLNNYINALNYSSSILSTIPDELLDETIKILNSETELQYSIIDIGEDSDIYPLILQNDIYIEHKDIDIIGDEVYSLFCFYKIFPSQEGTPRILKLCADLQGYFDEIFGQETRFSTVFAVDQEGFPIYHSQKDIMVKRRYLGNLEVVSTALEGIGSGTIFYLDQNREEIFGAFAHIDLYNLHWGIISESPIKTALFYVRSLEEESNIQISEILFVSISILLITIVLVIAVSYFLAKSISNPIMEFENKAELISEGEYTQKIQIKSHNEIGRLADTFNLMTKKIEAYILELEKAAKDNEDLFFQSIEALASAIDAKDPYTQGHSERVTKYSIAISYALGLPDHIIKKVRIAAQLHDIGKIGIMDSILQKPGALNDEEYESMKKHPIYGAKIMERISKLHDIIPGMKHHHEKYDGSGYPDRISGDLIPLDARIISIADTFDAMTTTRPYQKKMEPDEVVEKIVAWGGTKYDPKIVIAFEKAYQESLRRIFYEDH